MFTCGGSALLGALAVMSLINKIPGRGRYVCFYLIMPFLRQASYSCYNFVSEYRSSLPNYNSINTESTHETNINVQPAFT